MEENAGRGEAGKQGKKEGSGEKEEKRGETERGEKMRKKRKWGKKEEERSERGVVRNSIQCHATFTVLTPPSSPSPSDTPNFLSLPTFTYPLQLAS